MGNGYIYAVIVEEESFICSQQNMKLQRKLQLEPIKTFSSQYGTAVCHKHANQLCMLQGISSNICVKDMDLYKRKQCMPNALNNTYFS